LWTPELGKAHTAVIVREVDALPTWAAERVRDLVVRSAPTAPVPFAVTAERFRHHPAAVAHRSVRAAEIVRVLATGNRTMQDAAPNSHEPCDALPQDLAVQHSHTA
jgi:hypothetical protein